MTMPKLSDLPPELLLKVLSYLSIPSIHVVESLSQTWRRFIETHQRSVYHQAAFSHGYIPEMSSTWDEAKASYASPAIHRAKNWRSFCKLTRSAF